MSDINPLQRQWQLRLDNVFAGMAGMKEDFVALSSKRVIRKHQFVFCQGELGDSAFYIEEGRIKAFRMASSAKECLFFIHGAGELFGVSEVLGLNIRKADAEALCDSTLYEIKKAQFELFLKKRADFARRVMETQARRIRYLCDQIENLMSLDLSKRLLRLFLYLSHHQLNDSLVPNDPVTVPVRLTQEEIASLTGSNQQTISEALAKLKKEGYIKISAKEITLTEPIRIMRYCEMID